jgi:hypothetical protein
MEAKRILALHKKEGHLSSENGKKRRELDHKLFKAWDKEREKAGLMANGGNVLITKEEKAAKKRLEEIRKELRAERISYDELVELESLKEYIDKDDIELLQAAGVEENGYDDELDEIEYAKGGTVKKKITSKSKPKPSKKVGKSVQDKHRFAKPAGWRWKEEAFQKRIIERKQLAMSPSKKMRDKYPDYVYYEDRLNKADQHPTRTSADSI